MYMLDTNICIYVLKNHSQKLRHRFNVHKDLCISAVTYAELCFGIENGSSSLKAQRWEQLFAFTRMLLTLAVDEEVARHYGSIRAQLKRDGNPIGSNDLFIAAHARSTQSTLVTNNQREFKRVEGLAVENWV
jgi:tRNA(fMet)-specific endonuclease VapC